MRPSDVFYSVPTGPEHLRKLLTPVGLIVFSALLSVELQAASPDVRSEAPSWGRKQG